MDPRELRIGNIVKHPTVLRAPVIIPTKISPVQALERGHARFLEDEIMAGIDVPYRHLAGVSVTEGLLKAIGFTSEGYTDGCMEYGHFFSAFVLELHVGEWCWVFTDGGREFRRAVKYLHELQNLFFILGGEEFPINITDIQ